MAGKSEQQTSEIRARVLDSLVDDLYELARSEHRSLSGQVTKILEEHLEARREERDREVAA